MSEAKQGDTVDVHFTGRLADGSEFGTSQGGEPLTFQIGGGEVLQGIENAVVGMSPGDSKTVTLPAGEAYGDHQPQLVSEVSREEIPAEIDLQVGTRLQAQDPQGQTVVLEVVEVSDNSVSLDANHPLAGKDLTFDLELVNVRG